MKSLVRIITLTLLALAVFVFSWVPFDLDFFTYRATGRFFFEKGLSPFVDHFSVHFLGNPIVPTPWLFSVLLGIVDGMAGETGLFLLRFVIYFSAIGGLYLVSDRLYKNPKWISFAISLAVFSCLSSRLTLRPETMSYLFALIFLFQLDQLRRDRKFLRALALLPGLVLWQQFHHTSFFGHILILNFVGVEVVNYIGRRSRDTEWLKFVGIWGLASVLVGFINAYPTKFHPFLTLFYGVVDWPFKAVISEFTMEYAFRAPAYVGVWLLTIVHLTFLISKKDFYWVVLVAGYGVMAMVAGKVMPHFSLVLGYSILATWRNIHGLLPLSPGVHLKYVYPLLAVFTFGPLFTTKASDLAPPIGKTPAVMEYLFPVDTVEFMNRYRLGGRVFSGSNYGGYLVSALSSEIYINADIRWSVLYPIEYFNHYNRAYGYPFNLSQQIKNYKYDYVVATHYEADNLRVTASSVRGLNLLYLGPHSSLFSVGGLNYPIASDLFFDPACVQSHDVAAIRKELSQFKTTDMAAEDLENAIGNLLAVGAAIRASSSFEEFESHRVISKSEFSDYLIAYAYYTYGKRTLALEILKTLEIKNVDHIMFTARIFLDEGYPMLAFDSLRSILPFELSRSPNRYNRIVLLYNQLKSELLDPPAEVKDFFQLIETEVLTKESDPQGNDIYRICDWQ